MKNSLLEQINSDYVCMYAKVEVPPALWCHALRNALTYCDRVRRRPIHRVCWFRDHRRALEIPGWKLELEVVGRDYPYL